MKIIKHEFEIPQLSLVNGELVECDAIKETYTFTLLHGGIGVFENNYGASLISTLLKFNIGEGSEEERASRLLQDSNFIKELASASYVKVDGGKFENTYATAQEFKEKEVINYLYDIDFVIKLIRMACDCIFEDKKQKNNNKTTKK